MAFPTTSVLDNFNRANTADIAGSLSWIGPAFGHASFGITGNQADGTANTNCNNFWNQTYVDTEVYITLSDLFYGGNRVAVGARYDDSPNVNGYFLFWQYGGGTQSLGMYRHDSGVATQLGANFTITDLVPGDKIGLSVIGTTLTAYVYQGGVWTSLGTRTDSTYSSGILWLFSRWDTTNWLADDFGGGEVVPVSASRKFQRNSVLGV